MDKLLKLASQSADQAEVFFTESSADGIEFNDSKLQKADTSLSSGIALRVIKNGRMGLAYTRNLLDRDALVRQALQSAQNGVEVGFRFPHTQNVIPLDTYSHGIEHLNKQDLIRTGNEIISYIRQRTDGQINVGINYGTMKIGVMNSAGTNLFQRGSEFGINANLVFPGTGSGIYSFKVGKDFANLDKADIDEMIELFLLSKKEVVPPTKKMPVIFTPFSIFALLSRFSAASSPVSIYNKISPLCGKIGDKIFSDKLSIRQDPFDPDFTDSSSFDSEGTPTQKISFVENGIFSAIPTDLNYADKLGLAPTGNGLRGSIEGLPGAQAFNVSIDPGKVSLQEMISGIKEGIIVQFLMGAHSGNVLHGDYSVGVSSGFMIENGRITGRVKDCLLSGNAYETLSHIEAIEDKLLNLGSHKLPSLLCADVSVAGK